MSKVLLIDYGASRIKSVLYDSINDLPIASFESEGSFVKYGNYNKIPGSFFSKSLILHLDYYSNEVFNLKEDYELEIYICSEMHGFSLLEQDNLKSTYYYSWRFKNNSTDLALEILSDRGFHNKTSMILRPGLPVVNILAKSLNNEIKDGSTFLTLPQLICYELGEHYNLGCKTLLHSSGFYTDLGNKEDSFGITGIDLPIYFPSVLDDYKNPLGFIKYNNKRYNLYFGFGDLQAAFLGSSLNETEILINIGTGSQIISNFKNKSTFGLEERPFFEDEKLKCVTHIPAGRFLNSWCKFYDRLNSKNNFWKELSLLKYEDFEASGIDIKFDLYLDSESEYFEAIRHLTLNNSTITSKVLLSSLIKSFCNQYLSYLNGSIDKSSKIILGGGIPSKIPIIANIIEMNIDREVNVKKDQHDLTLIGLRDFINRGF